MSRAQSATKSVQLGQSAENCFHPLGLRFTEAFDFCGWSAKKCVLLRARICSLSQQDRAFLFFRGALADALGRQFVDHPERRHRQHGEPRRNNREHRGPLPQQRADGDRQPIERAGQNDDPPQRCIARAAFEIRYVLRDPGRDIPGNGHARGQAQHRIQHEDDDLPRCRIG